MVLFVGLAACGNNATPPAPRVRSGAPADVRPVPPSATTSASAAPSASAGPSASASSSAGPLSSAMASLPSTSGPVKWVDFTGPFEKPTLKGGEHVWAVLPVSTGWETLKFAEHEVTRVDDTTVVFRIEGTAYEVPAVFVNQVEPPRDIEKGDAVMASAHDARVFGRVLEVGSKIKVRFRFASDNEELEVEPAGIIKLDGKLKFGAPVLVQDEIAEGAKVPQVHPSQFISQDGASTWVVTFTGKPLHVPNANVHVMSAGPLRHAGEKVWVARQEEVVPGAVREVLDDGIRYRIQLDAGGETVAPLEAVTASIPGTIAH